MGGTIRGRAVKGVLKPLDAKLDLPEGAEVMVTIFREPDRRDHDAFHVAAGGWKDKVDCNKLIRDIYRSRLGLGSSRRTKMRRRAK